MKSIVTDKERGSALNLEFGNNLYTGLNSLEQYFSNITSLEIDILNLASSIYAADLAVKRSELEDYIRTIDLEIEVVNYHALELIREDIEEALFILSSDNWSLKFSQSTGTPESKNDWEDNAGTVLLFSGGLDSFSGAVHYLSAGEQLALVSHINQNRIVKSSQESVLNSLGKKFDRSQMQYYPYRVYARNQGANSFPTDSDRENTQRTRSFLFLALAALTARRLGFRKIISMAENGQFAIHLPLTQARIGPFSTHTANPEFLVIAQRMFRHLLNYETLEITNPFLYKTKAEVVGILGDELLKEANQSVSCWMASRITAKNHCGECIPCISRRISTEYNNVKIPEFSNDIWDKKIGDLSPDDNAKRNLIDYLDFISGFKDYNASKREEIMSEYFELHSEAIDADKAIGMYSRMADQSYFVFENYPEIKKLY